MGFDVANDVTYYLSYGIEAGGLKHKISVTEEEKMDCPAIKFEHGIYEFVIGGIKEYLEVLEMHFGIGFSDAA